MGVKTWTYRLCAYSLTDVKRLILNYQSGLDFMDSGLGFTNFELFNSAYRFEFIDFDLSIWTYHIGPINLDLWTCTC